MTLHQAIEKLLIEFGRPMTAIEIADEINKNKYYQKQDKSTIIPFQIYGRIKNYPSLFRRDGNKVFLCNKKYKYSGNLREKESITENLNQSFDIFSRITFCDFDKLDTTILAKTGLYCIRLKAKSRLPERYDNIISKRENNIIYIGKAQKQTLNNRLRQEVYHVRPGTFFRSIGTVLNFTPIPGHLKGKGNQKNYKFSKKNTIEITNWILANTEFAIYPINKDFSIEEHLIKIYCPLLNDRHNPMKLSELKEDRKRCREIAIKE